MVTSLGRGSRYRFQMDKREGSFELVATSLTDGLTSTINTLNEILSAFDINETSPNVEGPDWEGSDEEIRAWSDEAVTLFSNRAFISSLEESLDKDRLEGEWVQVEE